MATIFSVASPLDESPPIDAGETLRKPLSLWPRLYNSTVTNALWQVRRSILESHVLNFSLRPPQSQWPVAPKTKSPSQSRTSILYNFSSDHILREQYRDPYNEVRIGKLLEDLDALAGTIALKHCSDYDDTPRPLLLVTASLDKMVLKKPIRVDTDLKVVGAVTWVGRSSIEIQMIITELSGGDTGSGDSVALITNFTFVSRDLRTGKSTPVDRLVPQTDTEKALLAEGEARDVRRKKERQRRGREFEESNRLHGDGDGDGERVEALLREGRVLCDMPAALADRDSILIKDTRLVNALVCQPQRNLHGRIFGGFLMHRAFELAFSTCYAFVGRAPCFLKVDRVDFLRPVHVGDFLCFKSCVLFTQLDDPKRPLISIEVVAHVTRPELRSSEVSNTFYFTFTVHPDALEGGLKIRKVLPITEEEARRVLERLDADQVISSLTQF